MLFISKRFKVLLSFAAGASTLILVTTALEGPGIWIGYLDLLFSFGKASGGMGSQPYRPLTKYVDLAAFSALVPGGHSLLGLASASIFILGATISLFWVWSKCVIAPRSGTALMWAATLTWSLILNIYAPIYDSILVTLSVIVTLGILRRYADSSLRWVNMIWLLIFATSWVTESVAKTVGLQVITIAIIALGIFQIGALCRLFKSHALI